MMKTLLSLSLVLGLAGSARAAGSMDPLAVGGDIYKKVFENSAVRVMEATFAPGAKVAMHTHPDHFAYVLTGGTLRISHGAAQATEVVVTPGQVVWIDAVSHAAENSGTTELKILVTELKGHKTKKKPAAK